LPSLTVLLALAFLLAGCGTDARLGQRQSLDDATLSDTLANSAPAAPESSAPDDPAVAAVRTAEQLRAELGIAEDIRPSLDHGPKPAVNQRYIVLHDTEGSAGPEEVISWWDGNGNLVAAHFAIGKDGHIAQCVPIDRIAHHAGYGDVGHNELYGISEDGRDDMLGSVAIGSSYPDYAMNAWSIGIELVHVGGEGPYPAEQLAALDQLIAYLDAAFADAPSGNAGSIVDHKAWRSGNSDTSWEFAPYLASYQQRRSHS
jgi:hypothetical protein